MAVRRVLRRVLVFFLVLGGLWALWEGYKWLWERTGWTKPFRVNNYTLPHLHEILLQLREPTSTGDDLWLYLLHAALFTARAAAVSATRPRSHSRAFSHVSVQATRCAPFSSPVSSRSCSSSATVRFGSSATA